MPDISVALKDWSSTDSSNAPSGSTTIGTSLDDNLRTIQGAIVRGLSHKGADIASAGTTDLGAIEGLSHDITGTTTITSFGTVRAGIWKLIKFEGALTVTHNATSLILPGAANITTANGDCMLVISEGSGNWRCFGYLPATSFLKLSGGTLTGELNVSASVIATKFRTSTDVTLCTNGVATTLFAVDTGCYLVLAKSGAGLGVAVVARLAGVAQVVDQWVNIGSSTSISISGADVQCTVTGADRNVTWVYLLISE